MADDGSSILASEDQGSSSDDSGDSAIPNVRKQKRTDRREKTRSGNYGKLEKLYEKMVREYWEVQLRRLDGPDDQEQYVSEAFDRSGRKVDLRSLPERLEKKRFNVAEEVFMMNSLVRNRDRF